MSILIALFGGLFILLGAGAVTFILPFFMTAVFIRPTPQDWYSFGLSLACLPGGLFLLYIANGAG